MRVPDRGRLMSNMSYSSPAEDDLSARRHDDVGRDIELLLERLAESREAIVRLLAAGSAGEETVATEGPGDDETVAEEVSTDDEKVAEELWQDNEIQYTGPAGGRSETAAQRDRQACRARASPAPGARGNLATGGRSSSTGAAADRRCGVLSASQLPP